MTEQRHRKEERIKVRHQNQPKVDGKVSLQEQVEEPCKFDSEKARNWVHRKSWEGELGRRDATSLEVPTFSHVEFPHGSGTSSWYKYKQKPLPAMRYLY